jgi:phosphoribosylanthranilate isomerase
MSLQVKVCGITSLADAEKALEFGADLLGFNFYLPSPRYIGPDKARAIIEALPQTCCNVALFVNETKERVLAALAHGKSPDGRQGYWGVQFHGDESADYCPQWGIKVIKAVRMKEQNSLAAMEAFPADFYLLDSWSVGYGGSGISFPWEWLDGLHANKLILSGGLSIENVVTAVRRVHPFGIDVCSGVEDRPGKKDYGKLKEFIAAAKST